jgi:hypothetical protein
VLLSDPQVCKMLEHEVVPCWESVRRVPQVTIDFGNGDVMHRTLKGNTCMYLLRDDGAVVDAFPGVYTPADFLPQVRSSLQHVQQSDADVLAWHRAICKEQAVPLSATPLETTVSKAVVESPLLGGLGVGLPQAVLAGEPRARSMYGVAFNRFTQLIEDDSHRPQPASAVMRKTGARTAAELVAADSERSIRVLRLAAHLMLADGERLPQPAECRDIIFKRVLGVPLDDPHLGLDEVKLPGTP